MGVVVHIDKFSGPMALLLHLIRREEMDIFDININEITKQYLDSIKAMKKLNLEMAGDFIAMAATLIQIKSKMLLPQYNEEGEVVQEEDPRKDLVRRLLEYQMYQEAGRNLYNRELLGRDSYVRGEREDIDAGPGEILLEEDNALYSLISTYRVVVKNMKKAVHKVAQSLQSIADRIWQMREKLVMGAPTRLSVLLDKEAPDQKGHLLITFLSLLELAKIGIVNLFQSDNFADIHVDTKKSIDRDVISRVESYESQANENPGMVDIWLSDADRAAGEEVVKKGALDGESLQLSLAADEVTLDHNLEFQGSDQVKSAATDEAFEIAAATDDEIELEEKLYGGE